MYHKYIYYIYIYISADLSQGSSVLAYIYKPPIPSNSHPADCKKPFPPKHHPADCNLPILLGAGSLIASSWGARTSGPQDAAGLLILQALTDFGIFGNRENRRKAIEIESLASMGNGQSAIGNTRHHLFTKQVVATDLDKISLPDCIVFRWTSMCFAQKQDKQQISVNKKVTESETLNTMTPHM